MLDRLQAAFFTAPNPAVGPPLPSRIPGAIPTAVIGAAVIALAQGLSLLFWSPEPRISMVWLPGGLFLGALLVLPRDRWLALWIGTTAGVALGILPFGLSPATALPAALGPLFLATVTAWVLRRSQRGRPAMEDFGLLTLFAVYAGVLAPLAGAPWVLIISRSGALAGHFHDWLNLALAQALGYVLLAPAILGHAVSNRHRGHRFTWRAKVFGALLFAIPCVAWAFRSSPDYLAPLQLLAAAPFIVWAVLRYGLVGACYSILAVAMLAFAVSEAERGPFVHGDTRLTIIGLQLMILWGSLAMLYLSVMVEQRRTDHAGFEGANRRLSLLAGNLIHAQEIERSRIARDLHDDINQSVASISIKLSMAKQKTVGDVRERLDELQAEVLAVSEDIRQLSHRLHPSLLRYSGLAPALRALCASHGLRGSYALEASIDDGVDVPADEALALFRIAQEALGNIDSHAQAKRVGVSLGRVANTVFLEVCDDGVGFADDGHHGADVGLGLISMEERAKGIGATFEITSRPGLGTRVRVVLPALPALPAG